MKPCPFCGEAKYLKVSEYGYLYSVECEHCLAGGPMERTREEAVEKWDERISVDNQIQPNMSDKQV